MLSAAGVAAAATLAGCVGDTDDDDENGEADEIPGPVDGLEVLVANSYDGGPVFDGEQLHYRDYATSIKGLGMAYSAQRWNELGHEEYGGLEVMTEDQPETAEYVVDLYDSVQNFFYDDDELAAYAEADDDGWSRDGGPRLSDYEDTVFTYHSHHRGIGRLGRVAEHLVEEEGYDEDDEVVEELRDLRDTISFAVASVFSNVSWVLNERLEDGEFVDAEGGVTTESMCLGMRSLNGLGYAWQRRNGPDGAGDAEQPGMGGMGNVSHDAMTSYLGGYDEQALSEAMVDIAQALEDYWDDDAGAFDFGEGTTYHINELGALLDGLKAIYEFLYIGQFEDRSGQLTGEYDDYEDFDGHPYPDKVQDQDLALQVLEYTGTMLEAIFESDIDWETGAPEEVEFSGGELQAASDTVDVGATWKFLNQLWGGWSVFRERESEDSPQLLQENYPGVWDSQDDVRGPVLEGGVLDGNHLNDDDYPVASISYDDGSVENDTVYTATAANMLMGIENVYRGSEDPEFRDWDDADSAVITEDLFDVFQANIDLLQDDLILHEAP